MTSNYENESVSSEDLEAYQVSKQYLLSQIEKLILKVIDSLVNQKPLMLQIKTGQDNSVYRTINFLHKRSTRTFSLYIKCLSIIQGLIENDNYSTTRDIYYQCKDIFESQIELTKCVDDLARTLDVSRNSLHILSSNKGLIAGPIELLDVDGNFLNCMNTNSGIIVPNHSDMVQVVTMNAKFVLIVEKDAVFKRLLDDNFLQKYQAILMTGKGMPDISTRQLAHVIWRKFKLPFYCLVDANPFGIQIMAVYKYGSLTLSHQNENLTIESLKFLGLNLLDLQFFSIKTNYLFKLTETDRKKAVSLLHKTYLQKEPEWKQQLEYMLNKNLKVEIQCLQSISQAFLCDVYIKTKLRI